MLEAIFSTWSIVSHSLFIQCFDGGSMRSISEIMKWSVEKIQRPKKKLPLVPASFPLIFPHIFPLCILP